ncbi:hypothetical protein ILUMI_16268, partial [Ignelater luminosus]
RVHNAGVFRNSPLFEQLTGNPALLPPNQHLIGDAAYHLLTNLMKPFRDNGHLTPIQTRFNQVFSAQRSVIERAFVKWRRLKYLDMALADKIPEMVLTAYILHNFLLRRVEEHEYKEAAYEFKTNEDDEIDLTNLNVSGDANNNATLKREYITSLEAESLQIGQCRPFYLLSEEDVSSPGEDGKELDTFSALLSPESDVIKLGVYTVLSLLKSSQNIS